MWCGLRDFPPPTDGYGKSRVFCIFSGYETVYQGVTPSYFMWRVEGTKDGPISSGDEVYLYVYQPMSKYCVHGARLECGVSKESATKFVVEKASGTGVINFTTETVYFRVGTKYCSLSGRRHSQQIKCTGARSAATPFQLPASTFASVQLINNATKEACGGDFYAQDGAVQIASCGPYFAGKAINMTVNLQRPGAPAIASGTNVSFNVFDDLYTYQISTWKVRSSDKRVFLDENDITGTSKVFSLLAITGSTIANNTLVAIRSEATGQFCGVAAAPPSVATPNMTCNGAGPLDKLTASYVFSYRIMA
ncbi:hypothetical protein GPECTOR_20g533 [Gonium pectorale]|uniref:Uncharacterized protein n=1 Tax=Gonium pectorale TaxID=33097 RepID=A0A150GIM9_GONPE|nr:hypothetical protein GPECTOR_20g533 [Gonium pectorale]|eukprot:KXZ49676.1 hypothetical protein GPECTOR_20g533 [Gonium pectorale]